MANYSSFRNSCGLFNLSFVLYLAQRFPWMVYSLRCKMKLAFFVICLTLLYTARSEEEECRGEMRLVVGMYFCRRTIRVVKRQRNHEYGRVLCALWSFPCVCMYVTYVSKVYRPKHSGQDCHGFDEFIICENISMGRIKLLNRKKNN